MPQTMPMLWVFLALLSSITLTSLISLIHQNMINNHPHKIHPAISENKWFW